MSNTKVEIEIVNRLLFRLAQPKYSPDEYKKLLLSGGFFGSLFSSTPESEFCRLTKDRFPPKSTEDFLEFFHAKTEIICVAAFLSPPSFSVAWKMAKIGDDWNENESELKELWEYYFVGGEAVSMYAGGLFRSIVDSNYNGEFTNKFFDRFFAVFPIAFIRYLWKLKEDGEISLSERQFIAINEGARRIASTLSPGSPKTVESWKSALSDSMTMYPDPTKIDWDAELGGNVDPNGVLGSYVFKRVKEIYLPHAFNHKG